MISTLFYFTLLELFIIMYIMKFYYRSYINFFNYYAFTFILFFLIPSLSFFSSNYFIFILFNIFLITLIFGIFTYKILPTKNFCYLLNNVYSIETKQVQSMFILYILLVFIYLIGVNFSLPPIFTPNVEMYRAEYMVENSKYLRIVKYFIPFVSFYILYWFDTTNKTIYKRIGYFIFLFLTLFLMLYEGSKSSIIGYILFLYFFYKVLGVKPNYISYSQLLIFAFFSIVFMLYFYINQDILEFLKYRLYSNNLSGLNLSVNFYTTEHGYLFGNGVLNPIKIFLSKVFMIDFHPTYLTPGNLMAKYEGGIIGHQEYYFELLNTLIGDAYLDFGILGVFFYTYLLVIVFLIIMKKIQKAKKIEDAIMMYFLSIVIVQMLFIGKIGSYITSNIISYLVIFIIIKFFLYMSRYRFIFK